MPPRFEGQRRLPGLDKIALIFAYYAILMRWLSRKTHCTRRWLSGQSIPRRIGMGVALYLVITLSAYVAFGGNACAVAVNGNVVAVVSDKKSACEVLGGLLKIKSAQAGGAVAVAEKITYQGVRAKQEDFNDLETLKDRLEGTLTFQTKGTAIHVNGEAKVFLKQEEDAKSLLGWLITVYPVEVGEQPEFKENVELVKTSAPISDFLGLEEAKNLVLLGTNKVQQYTVKDGDTLWDIARSVKIDMDQIQFSNPGLVPEKLSIGQVLNLSKEVPLITVVATREVTVNEEIPFPVEVQKDDGLLFGEQKLICKGESGERIVTYRIKRENGFETDREIISQTIVREAKKETVAKGSLTMLASRGGTACLSWPCAGGIESPFGMRWGRMHEGVDLGANYGSNVVAVAGGTVIDTGWQGGYGKTVEISHGSGLVTRYCHLSSICVDSGQAVERGELIGLVGSTGNSTGPHLHFEVLIGGQPRNPINYLE